MLSHVRARRAVSLSVFLAMALLMPLAAPARGAATLTLGSGNGAPGGVDALVESSVDGESWAPAEIAAPLDAWATIPGTAWLTRTSPGASVVFYRVVFSMPAEFSDPLVSVDLHADDMAMVFLNGTIVGMQSPGAGPSNYQGDPETFASGLGFKPGANVLWFRVSVFDDSHGVDFRATVTYGANEPPTADAGGPYEVSEGGSIILTGSGTDPDGDTLTFAWDLDGDWTFETPGGAPTFSAAALDGPTTRPVRLRVCDPDAACTIDAATVSVSNVAPTATLVAPPAALDGTLAMALAGAADPGVADTAAGFTYSFDCGDGAGPTPFGPASATTCPSGPLGPRTISASVRDRDGGITIYGGETFVYGPTPGGIFVIGDGSATGTVTFWGARWTARNVLSDGPAPAAFQGFAAAPGTVCGDRWVSAGGTAASAPVTIPEYVAVIVTSQVSKDAAGFTGTTVGMVVVRTDPGYQPKPGIAGTGTVVARIC